MMTRDTSLSEKNSNSVISFVLIELVLFSIWPDVILEGYLIKGFLEILLSGHTVSRKIWVPSIRALKCIFPQNCIYLNHNLILT